MRGEKFIWNYGATVSEPLHLSAEPWSHVSGSGRGPLFRGQDGSDREVRALLSDHGCELPDRRCDHAHAYARGNAHVCGRGSVRGGVSCRHENVHGYGGACDHGRVNAHARGCLAL